MKKAVYMRRKPTYCRGLHLSVLHASRYDVNLIYKAIMQYLTIVLNLLQYNTIPYSSLWLICDQLCLVSGVGLRLISKRWLCHVLINSSSTIANEKDYFKFQCTGRIASLSCLHISLIYNQL